MNDTDIRILYGKLTMMESELEDAYRAIRRLEEWIIGMKSMLSEELLEMELKSCEI